MRSLTTHRLPFLKTQPRWFVKYHDRWVVEWPGILAASHGIKRVTNYEMLLAAFGHVLYSLMNESLCFGQSAASIFHYKAGSMKRLVTAHRNKFYPKTHRSLWNFVYLHLFGSVHLIVLRPKWSFTERGCVLYGHSKSTVCNVDNCPNRCIEFSSNFIRIIKWKTIQTFEKCDLAWQDIIAYKIYVGKCDGGK
jgi:hypothetical protein